ncbi:MULTISPECIES: fimbrial protein [Pseudomonas]|uniref:fimbrial protein n=1 Tax=Pseudomonas TaxID=286 RepID=UPI001070A106|nr:MULTISPECIES: fimbrial protein [Pseudomonas]QBR29272.1 type 1 fimbrial protein [Pseudomonas sp. S150]UZT92763.1 fimbrial protein [Pseudomonas koreensis]
MKFKLTHLLMGMMLVGLGEAHAYTCSTETSSTTITVPEFTVQQDLPVNAEIGRVESNTVSAYKCTENPGEVTWQDFGGKAYGTYLKTIDGKRVYESGIKGIGYAVGVTMLNCSEEFIGWVGPAMTDNPDDRFVCSVNGMFGTQPIQGKAYIMFYKTAEVTGSGEVASKTVGAFILRNNKNSWNYPESSFNIGSLKVNTVSCSLSAPSINVEMGKVAIGHFGGVGTWPGDDNTRTFSVPLDCSAGASTNLKVEGNVQDASQGVLKVGTGNSSASGVGIQLLYDDKPVELGKQFKTGTASSQGIYNIPLKARYLQTEDTITPGTANGSATITLNYQ